MGLFSKKFDLEKDRLTIRFDLSDKVYKVYNFRGESIDYNSLNRKSKKMLDNKNKELSVNEELMQNEIKNAKMIQRGRKLRDLGYPCGSFEVFGEIKGSMSKNVETFINDVTSQEDVLIGIHRVGAFLSQEQIEDILINGLQMSSHSGSGASSNINLADNVGYYPDNHTIIKELMYANTYKNSTGSILIRIPDSDLRGNIFITNEDGVTVLNPKYILGYVPVDENHHIETILYRDDVIRKRNSYSTYSDTIEIYEPFYIEEQEQEKGRTR